MMGDFQSLTLNKKMEYYTINIEAFRLLDLNKCLYFV